ncbi:MAG: tRNA (cytidine(34)-2'-O)-methyltransferase, partial [Clostridiales Family XIII bacterium]|nr:tRNA (cytidine(34)-2'-O)-methyltransferase [Clostridiales Family XIII bacterium]
MKPFHIALIEPQIPPNTGNIARTCAATGTALHLVKPLGFDVSDRALKRAGLDYWPLVNLKIHENLESFMREYEGNPMYFVTTKGRRVYCETDFEEGAMFLFGKETAGLGEALLRENAE